MIGGRPLPEKKPTPYETKKAEKPQKHDPQDANRQPPEKGEVVIKKVLLLP